MKKLIVPCLLVAGLVAAAAVGIAAQPPNSKATKAKFTREKVTGSLPNLKQPGRPLALVTLDYYDTATTAYGWTGNFYMSNLFMPTAGSWPLQVLALEVYANALDNVETVGTPGVLNGVAVFDPTGAILARDLGVAATVKTWTTVPLSAPPVIAAGNFVAGMWNSNVGAGARNDAGLQASAMNWPGAAGTEPFRAVGGGMTAGAAGPWVVDTAPSSYTTTSAAAVRAQINTGVPVELMRFEVE